jgi:hypothetical protein
LTDYQTVRRSSPPTTRPPFTEREEAFNELIKWSSLFLTDLIKKGKLGAFLAILYNSLVALLTSLDFENNYDYSTQATTPPFSQQLAVGAAHLIGKRGTFLPCLNTISNGPRCKV